MTQNNLYMEDDEMRLYVDVQPLLLDEIENSRNAAVASAALAAQSEENARNWKNSIVDYKTAMELFYAQASDGLTNLYNNSKSELTLSKNNVLNNIEMAQRTAINNINTNGQNYITQVQTIVDNRVSTEHLNQSKCLMTGEETTDSDAVNQVKGFAHSTFDRTKFSVVGYPVVTDDGNASGFSSGNYLTTPNTINFSTAKTWSFKTKFNTGSAFSTIDQGVLSGDTVQNVQAIIDMWGVLRGGFGDGTAWIWNLNPIAQLELNTDYILEMGYNGTAYYIKLNGVLKGSYLSDTKVSNTPIRLGVERTNGYFFTNGSFDLKQFSITVDGVVVFSGNKTGIDMIKPDDYTASNSANITADGVFDQALGYGYITIDDIGIDVNRPFKIEIPFTKIASTSSGSYPVGYYENSFANVYMNDGGISPKLVFDDNGTATILTTSPTYLAVPNIGETVNFVIEYDGNQTYTISVIKQNGTVSSGTITTSLKLNSTKLFVGRATYGETTQYMKVDLNKLKAWSAGDLVYQGCLKIPYTLSKTGSKIVNAVYRDRVKCVYDMGFVQGYYALDEENNKAWLPIGDIYGMIENLRNLIIERTSE